MYLPEAVNTCIHILEDAGAACYAVGGCVRDACLGLTPQDYDLCTAATPETVRRLFADYPLVLAGEKHGTVGVVTQQGVVEITTFRTEGDYQDSRHPDWVKFTDTIEDDLARRDFTVNAMAYSPTRGFADPFGGRVDLEAGILRAVGHAPTRFREDALRILRGVRFAVRFHLMPEKETLAAMVELATTMEKLAAERVFDELCKLLPLVTAQDLITFAPVLTAVLPELGPTVGFQQHSPHHLYDVFTHTAYVVEAAPGNLAVRWAALLHDVGKVPTFTQDENGRGHFYGHAEISAQMADAALLRLKAPTQLRQQVVFLIQHHMQTVTPDRKLLRRLLSRYGEENLRLLLALQEADFHSKGVAGDTEDFFAVRAQLEELVAENACLRITDLAIDGHDLMALGYQGREIGQELERLLNLVLEETLENAREALLSAAKKEKKS